MRVSADFLQLFLTHGPSSWHRQEAYPQKHTVHCQAQKANRRPPDWSMPHAKLLRTAAGKLRAARILIQATGAAFFSAQNRKQNRQPTAPMELRSLTVSE